MNGNMVQLIMAIKEIVYEDIIGDSINARQKERLLFMIDGLRGYAVELKALKGVHQVGKKK